MKTTITSRNPGTIDRIQSTCVMGNPDIESSPGQNTEGKTIRCDDQTDCQIKLVDTGRAGRFINLGQHLKEHRRMSHSLNLAKEVQQSLLPRTTPQFAGLDIAGKSMYCDETGGDYFDYHELNEKKHKKLGVAIGDVSGHGISAALLMATVRAALRQRVCLGGSLEDIICDVNRQLVSDVEDSGQFMGLFYLVVDPANRNVKWVRAGHPPAILYDPETDFYEELNGLGLVLGVDPGQKYAENEKRSLKTSQIIVLATDGILEARNSAGDMFGKESIVNVIRQNKAFTAKQILNAVFDSLQRFRHKAQLEDDMTLVVIKLVK